MDLDMRTLLVASAFEVIASTLVLALVWRAETRLRPITGFLSLGQALMGLGLVLLASQGRVSVLWGVIISNVCMMVGFAAEQEGISRYVGKKGYLRMAVLALPLCVGVGMWFFCDIYASLAYRIITFSLAAMAFSLIFITTLLSSAVNQEAPVRLLVATHVCQFAVMGLRAAGAFLQEEYTLPYLELRDVQAGLVLSLSLCHIGRIAGYFWLLVHCLLQENQSQAEAIEQSLNMRWEITEKIVNERTKDLQASESKVRALIDAIPDMLVVSSGEGRIEEIYANADFSARFPRHIFLGKLIQDVLPRVHADDIVRLTRNAIVNRQNSQYEFILPWGTEKLPLHTRIIHLNDSQAFHVITDITEQKRLEAQMLRALSQLQEAQKLSTAGVMAASIVHDLGQPLNAIKVSASGLLYISELGTALTMDKVLCEVQRISRQVDRMEAVITNVRNIVRQDTHFRRNILLEKALLRAIDAFQSVPGTAVAVQYQFELSNALVFAADSEIEQIIFNLLKNAQEAVDACAKPDKIIMVSATTEKEWTEITVSDNGSGIEEAILPRVFEPFFTTKKYGSDNLGFGLAIIKSLTESLKGSVSVRNNEMGGATFVVCLPLEKEEESAGNGDISH